LEAAAQVTVVEVATPALAAAVAIIAAVAVAAKADATVDAHVGNATAML
jgi:hypothetical protein